MNAEQQRKIDWLSRAKMAELTASTLEILQKQDSKIIQKIEPFKEETPELFQNLQKSSSQRKEELIRLAKIREEIYQLILTIADEKIRNIFLRKYLAYETNEQIAEAMFYDLRTIQRKHKKALDSLIIPDFHSETI